MDRQALIALINKFINGSDCSISLANEIEIAIDEAFPNDELMQDAVLMLASYRPGGGDYLYNEAQIKNMLKRIYDKLEQENKS